MKKLCGLILIIAIFPVSVFADSSKKVRTVRESVPSGPLPDYYQIAKRLLDRSKEACAQEGLAVIWESEIIDHRFLFWETQSLQFRCGPSPDAACGTNPGTSNGTRNFDGSCSYDAPQVYVGGQMVPVEATPEAGAGFCALQKMSLRAVDSSACEGQDGCQAPAVLLSSDGRLIGIDQGNDSSELLSHVICGN